MVIPPVEVPDLSLTTVWTGEKITFTKGANQSPTIPTNQDIITDKVKLSRGENGGQLINMVSETENDKLTSPAGTLWA